MSSMIEDGKGTGKKAKVDGNNRLGTHSITESESLHATEQGHAFNISSGNITYTAAGTMLYIKNTDSEDLVIEAIAIGLGSGTTSDSCEITISSNATGGDLLTDATAVPIIGNRNFGSNKTIESLSYKGKSGGTLTGQTDFILSYAGAGSRLYLGIDIILKKGSSISVYLDPKLSSGSIKAYCAAICHLKDHNQVG